MVNIHIYVAKYKIDNSRFWNIFPDFVPPPSFMVGGGVFWGLQNMNMMDAASLTVGYS